jgi:hypothetical protein
VRPPVRSKSRFGPPISIEEEMETGAIAYWQGEYYQSRQRSGWLKWLDPVDRKNVWMRASGERWKNICWKTRLSRPAPLQKWAAALCVIEYCFAMSSPSPLLKAEAKDKLCLTEDMPITRNVGKTTPFGIVRRSA